ncbi:metallophosphoesterase [uncultured Shewanella sp.]|uniref:metallophosphoesterase n=1 Tax=uncultured Shewanella sp. TaxID=173975 RepID=UPI0026259FFC|nr:metallophosphoesterase [uncultured Shewanella sp.]
MSQADFSLHIGHYAERFFSLYGHLATMYIDDDKLRTAYEQLRQSPGWEKFMRDRKNLETIEAFRSYAINFTIDLDALCDLFPYNVNELKLDPNRSGSNSHGNRTSNLSNAYTSPSAQSCQDTNTGAVTTNARGNRTSNPSNVYASPSAQSCQDANAGAVTTNARGNRTSNPSNVYASPSAQSYQDANAGVVMPTNRPHLTSDNKINEDKANELLLESFGVDISSGSQFDLNGSPMQDGSVDSSELGSKDDIRGGGKSSGSKGGRKSGSVGDSIITPPVYNNLVVEVEDMSDYREDGLFKLFNPKDTSNYKMTTRQLYPQEIENLGGMCDKQISDLMLNGKGFTGKVGLVGCQGISGESGKISTNIPLRIGRRLKSKLGPHDIAFLLGDNFYNDGLSANWKGQKKYNLRRYRNDFAHSFGLMPCFAILGNHDAYIHGKSAWAIGNRFNIGRSTFTAFNKQRNSTPTRTIERQLAQVRLTYLNKVNPYLAWNMPYRYYAMFSKIADFFVLDSSSFIYDKAQQQYLVNRYLARIAVANTKVLVLHHPFLPAGKRLGQEDDNAMYQKAFGVKNTPRGCVDSEEMGELIKSRIEALSVPGTAGPMQFDLIFCAHNHTMTIDTIPLNSGSTTQIISGGGGAPLVNSNLDSSQLYNMRRSQRGNLKSFYSCIHEITHGFHLIDLKKGEIAIYDEEGTSSKRIGFNSAEVKRHNQALNIEGIFKACELLTALENYDGLMTLEEALNVKRAMNKIVAGNPISVSAFLGRIIEKADENNHSLVKYGFSLRVPFTAKQHRLIKTVYHLAQQGFKHVNENTLEPYDIAEYLTDRHGDLLALLQLSARSRAMVIVAEKYNMDYLDLLKEFYRVNDMLRQNNNQSGEAIHKCQQYNAIGRGKEIIDEYGLLMK